MSFPVKKTLIASAVAAALASGSAIAAQPFSAVFYAGGGSAQANAFFTAVCRVATSVDVYSPTAVTAATPLDGSYYFMYGTLNQAIGGVAANNPVVFIYKFNGGSYTNGIAPQKTSGATSLQYPNVAATLANGPGSGNGCTTGQSTVLVPGTSWTGAGAPGLDAGDSPAFGLADVEVAMFQSYNNPSLNDNGKGDNQLNSDGGPAPSVGFSDGLYDNLFGLAVSADVFLGNGNALVGGVHHPKTNFTRAEVAGILAGTIQNWNQLYDDNGLQIPAGDITLLDRGEGSGTKASGNQYFLGLPGDGASKQLPYSAKQGYCNAVAGGTASGGITAANCDGSPLSEPTTPPYSDVWETSTNSLVADLVAAQGAHVRTVGILGLENPPAAHQVGGVNTYDFVSINGVAVSSGTGNGDINGASTTYNNVVSGQYDFYFQNSFNAQGTPAAGSFAAVFLNVFKQANFNGCNFGGADSFPAAVPGTLSDADEGFSATTTGATLNTRNHVSTGPLQPKNLAVAGGAPTCTDTL